VPSRGQLDPVLWLAYVHHTWRPSFVLEVRPDGRAQVRYVQSGWVVSLAEWSTSSANLLAAGGVLDEHGQPSVALIDLAAVPGASPADKDRNRCSGGSDESVRRLFLFPNLDTTKAVNPYDVVYDLHVAGTDLRVSYTELDATARLSPDLRVVEYGLADSYFVRHSNLQRIGLLDHGANECPFATSAKDIKEWSPMTGWHSVSVPPRPR
jgi:hypothetical protein